MECNDALHKTIKGVKNLRKKGGREEEEEEKRVDEQSPSMVESGTLDVANERRNAYL